MRTYDEDSLRAPKAHRAPEKESDGLDAALAHRAVAEHRPDTLNTRSVMHIQRAAGNKAAGAMLEEERSPVLDVVGRGGGSALDTNTRSKMEGAFGQDFSDVRVHTGGEAAKSATSVQAHAYTVGNDVVFGEGHYSPGTDSGERMLAHELTHVVQQRSGAVDGTPQAGGIAVSDPSDRFEQAAERNADAVMSSGKSETAPVAAAAAAPSVQRDASHNHEEEGAGASVQTFVQRQAPEEGEKEEE
jgi:hypothetical protein